VRLMVKIRGSSILREFKLIEEEEGSRKLMFRCKFLSFEICLEALKAARKRFTNQLLELANGASVWLRHLRIGLRMRR
jgi:hypothetical protein